jgi:HK97 family phage portal protein
MKLRERLRLARLGFAGKLEKGASQDLITHLPGAGWWPVLREGFSGAWQRNIFTPIEDCASHPTFWACVTLIAGDVAKCRPMLVQDVGSGVKQEVDNPVYTSTLNKPNTISNRIQFYQYWILSKLLRGNAYALKARDNRNVVSDLYLLDPLRVRPMITPTGDVYYSLMQDVLSGVETESLLVPASEIIHDPLYTLYHPLVGLSPVYACGLTTQQGLTIIHNATRLMRRGSQVSGLLVAPGRISDQTAKQLEKHWEENYAGEHNIGKIAVLGDGLKLETPKLMSNVDAQLIDQLRWDDEKICAALHVPPFKVGVGPLPSYNNVEALDQIYYSSCLQMLFESLELCLTEGLEMKAGYEVEFEVEALDRMDSTARMDFMAKGVLSGIFTPNEARARFNLLPIDGGDRAYLQRQNWPLEALGSDANAPTPPASGGNQ